MTEVKDKKIEIKEHEPVEEKKGETKTVEKPSQKIEVRRNFRPLSLFGTFDRVFDDLFWSPFRIFDYEPFSLSLFDDDEFFRTPLANVTEDEKGYHMTAELPGLDKGDLEITIHDGNLEIKGEKKEEHEDKDEEGFVRREYHSSSYHRTFNLPENVDEEHIDATLDKGILKVELPKKEPAEKEVKRVEVK